MVKTAGPKSPGRSTGRRSPEAARQEILDLAVEFLRHRPFRDLTVESLMRDASIGRSAFYVYFDDRADLAEALLQDLLEDLLRATRLWIEDESAEPWRVMRPALAELVDLFVRRGPLLRAFFDAASVDESFEELWRGRVLGSFHTAVAAQLRRQQAAGLVSPAVDPDEMARALNCLDERYLVDRFGTADMKVDAEQVIDTLTRIWTATLYPGRIDAPDADTSTG